MGRGLGGPNFHNWHQKAPKLRQSRTQELPRGPRGSPKSSQDGPKKAQREARGGQEPPDWGQEAPKWVQMRRGMSPEKGQCWKVGILKKHGKNNWFLMISIDFWGSQAWNFGEDCLVFHKKCLRSWIFNQKMDSWPKKMQKLGPKAAQEAPRRPTGGPIDIGPRSTGLYFGPWSCLKDQRSLEKRLTAFKA